MSKTFPAFSFVDFPHDRIRLAFGVLDFDVPHKIRLSMTKLSKETKALYFYTSWA